MIRSELDVLLDKVQDPALRADLQSQIDRLKRRRSFRLVFEQHIPERVRLPQHPIRVGSQVVSRDDEDSPTFEVILIDDGVATLVQVRDGDGAYVQRGLVVLGGQVGTLYRLAQRAVSREWTIVAVGTAGVALVIAAIVAFATRA